MSTFHNVEIACPECNSAYEVKLIDSLNVARHPAGRDAILARELHLNSCPHCHAHTVVDKPILYTDLDQGLFIQCLPETERLGFYTQETKVQTVFERVFKAKNAPAFMAEIWPTVQPRLVYGLEELREKIVVADAGLDDRLVEVLKLELMARWPGLLSAGLTAMLLDAVSEDGIEFVLHYRSDECEDRQPAPEGAPRMLGSCHDTYAELVEHEKSVKTTYAQLFSAGWVNILRYKFNPEDRVSAP